MSGGLNLRERMKRSKAVIVLIGEKTKNLYKFVRWEVDLAIELDLPIIAVNLNKKNRQDTVRCPAIIRDNSRVVHIYPVHVMTRKSFGLMTRKMPVTESQRSAQFPGTFSRRKLSVASANWAQVA